MGCPRSDSRDFAESVRSKRASSEVVWLCLASRIEAAPTPIVFFTAESEGIATQSTTAVPAKSPATGLQVINAAIAQSLAAVLDIKLSYFAFEKPAVASFADSAGQESFIDPN